MEKLGKQPLSDQEGPCGSVGQRLLQSWLCRCIQGRSQHRRRMKKVVKKKMATFCGLQRNFGWMLWVPCSLVEEFWRSHWGSSWTGEQTWAWPPRWARGACTLRSGSSFGSATHSLKWLGQLLKCSEPDFPLTLRGLCFVDYIRQHMWKYLAQYLKLRIYPSLKLHANLHEFQN